MGVVTKKPKVSIYLPPEIKEELDNWAEEENRSVSNLVETIIRETITKRRKKPKTQSQETETDEIDAAALLQLLASGKRPTDGEVLVVANESGIDEEELKKLRDRLFPQRKKTGNGAT